VKLRPRQYDAVEARNAIRAATARQLLMAPVLKVNVMSFRIVRSVDLNPVRDFWSTLITENVMKISQTAEDPVHSVAR